MTIKLIALDMDGTLLNRQKLVPEKNALAIKKAMDKGIYVTKPLVVCLHLLLILLNN